MKRHMRMDIAGALRNWSDSQAKGCYQHDDGTPMSPRVAKADLENRLALGHRFLPCGDCDNFDPENGCMGHEDEAGDGV